ncbi:MAG: NADH-quinone oxidoreductase subunit N [Candidatus Zixiibacteriota bacterium]|nr:MAG: NADH-quinone oxidoreductase subunit N [candidate division Zixibacteria bacterium]
MDYALSLSIDLSLVYAELALLGAAFVILLTSFTRVGRQVAPWATGLGLVLALLFALEQWGHQASGFADMVTCDHFGVLFKVIFILIAMLSTLIAHRFLIAKGIFRPEFYAMILVSTIGMMVMANSTDLVVIFLGLEIMSVPLYVMAAFNRRSLASNEAGIKYFIMGAFASAFVLMGIAFIFGAAETTNLRRVVADFTYIANNFGPYFYTGVALVLVGFAFKVGAVPFHTWVPDVYQGAPTPVTAFFSVGPKAAGFAALMRIFLYGFSNVAAMEPIFWFLAVLTMTVGNVLALRQDNVKRMLAYSSISHAGYLLVAMTVGGADAISAAVFYLVAYTLFNLGAFAVVTILETRAGCVSDFSEMRGLSRAHPLMAALLALFMFALSGFPPTVGFFGKFYIFSAAVHKGFIWLTIIGVMNSFVSVYYYLRVVKTSYFDDAEGAIIKAVVNPATVVALLIAMIGTLGLGILPEQLLQLTQKAIFAFI